MDCEVFLIKLYFTATYSCSFKINLQICTPLDILSKGVFLCRKITSRLGKWIEPYRLKFYLIEFTFIYLNFPLLF
ncbi:hypothetical protein D7V71_25630 [Bacillus thuringiensis]|nr:hypothetical protein D7V71_25630 [Bacillus thuringiensis]